MMWDYFLKKNFTISPSALKVELTTIVRYLQNFKVDENFYNDLQINNIQDTLSINKNFNQIICQNAKTYSFKELSSITNTTVHTDVI